MLSGRVATNYRFIHLAAFRKIYYICTFVHLHRVTERLRINLYRNSTVKLIITCYTQVSTFKRLTNRFKTTAKYSEPRVSVPTINISYLAVWWEARAEISGWWPSPGVDLYRTRYNVRYSLTWLYGRKPGLRYRDGGQARRVDLYRTRYNVWYSLTWLYGRKPGLRYRDGGQARGVCSV